MHPDRIIPQQTNKDVKSVWNCWSLHTHRHRRKSHCLHSFNYPWAQMNHSWILCQQTKTADDKHAADEREQTNVVFLCLSGCINLRRPHGENDLSGAGRRMKCWGDLRASPSSKCSVWTRVVSSIHPSPTDRVSSWPLPWVTNTLNALSSHCFYTIRFWRLSNKRLMLVSYSTDKKLLPFH